MEAIYTRPYLYPEQEAALFTPKRWALVEASTKSGKTVGCIAWIIEMALAGLAGYNYWWVAPISDQARIAFTRVKNGMTPGTFVARESPTPMITLANGTVISFKSADNPDSLYGEDVYGAVIDEASRAKPEAWTAVRSTLTATGGPARMIGNVKGRKNWFYHFCRRVEKGEEPNGHFARITVLDAIRAGVIPQAEIDDAKRNLSERDFRELYMAEPADDGGNPFGLDHIAACVAMPGSKNFPTRVVAWGIDLAKKGGDYVVLIGLDAYGRVAGFHRWRGVPWRDSIRRIHELVGENTPALVDSTGAGDPVLEELQVGHGNFKGYHFSATSKQRLMEGLAVSIQSHEITYPDGPIRFELDSFEYLYTATGVRYSAPEGEHDDCVCSLALAREQWSATMPGANLMDFYAAQARDAKARDEAARDAPVHVLTPENLGLRPRRPAPDVVTNELTALYEATLRSFEPEQAKCRECGEALGATRVSDGIYAWHPQCFGRQRAA